MNKNETPDKVIRMIMLGLIFMGVNKVRNSKFHITESNWMIEITTLCPTLIILRKLTGITMIGARNSCSLTTTT